MLWMWRHARRRSAHSSSRVDVKKMGANYTKFTNHTACAPTMAQKLTSCPISQAMAVAQTLFESRAACANSGENTGA